jgi:predicted permease
MAILVSAVLPIALVALVGFGIGRTFDLHMPTLSKVSIYGFLPALVLTSLAKTTLNLESALAIVGAFWLTTALLFGIATLVSRGLNFSASDHKSLMATTLFANVGNMGLPFVLFALGEAGLERAVVYLVGSSVLIATLFPILLKGGGIRAGLTVTLRLPVFWATVAGIALQAVNGTFPIPVQRGLTLLAEGAIPLALLTLGIQLSRTPLTFGRHELLGAGLRLVLSPLLAYGMGRLLGLTGLDLQVVVLQGAMPVAVNSLIWVTELGGNPDRVAKTIVLSTFLSLVSLPAVVWFLLP